jgi:hypothetical protein
MLVFSVSPTSLGRPYIQQNLTATFRVVDNPSSVIPFLYIYHFPADFESGTATFRALYMFENQELYTDASFHVSGIHSLSSKAVYAFL